MVSRCGPGNLRSQCQKFERRIDRGQFGERFGRRSRCHWKIGLHFALEAVEVGLQDWWLLRVGNRTQAEFPERASFLQSDLAGGFSVAHPLGSSARSYQLILAIQLQQIDWSGIEFAAFSSANFKQVAVLEAQPEAHEKSKNAVKGFLDRGGFAENGQAGVHDLILDAASSASQNAATRNSCSSGDAWAWVHHRKRGPGERRTQCRRSPCGPYRRLCRGSRLRSRPRWAPRSWAIPCRTRIWWRNQITRCRSRCSGKFLCRAGSSIFRSMRFRCRRGE